LLPYVRSPLVRELQLRLPLDISDHPYIPYTHGADQACGLLLTLHQEGGLMGAGLDARFWRQVQAVVRGKGHD